MSDLYRLEKFLFEEYTKIHRPVRNSWEAVNVSYDMALEQLIEVVSLIVFFDNVSVYFYNFVSTDPGSRCQSHFGALSILKNALKTYQKRTKFSAYLLNGVIQHFQLIIM